jgi:dipeptidase D
VVHAGLECGVIMEKFPNLELVSIGPKIENPHSTRDRVQIESVYHFFKKLEELILALQNRN